VFSGASLVENGGCAEVLRKDDQEMGDSQYPEEALVLEQWVEDMEEGCTRPPCLMWSRHPSSEDADGDSESVPRESVFRELSSSVLMHDDLHMNGNL
jgi:hypothetical protein